MGDLPKVKDVISDEVGFKSKSSNSKNLGVFQAYRSCFPYLIHGFIKNHTKMQSMLPFLNMKLKLSSELSQKK